MNFIFAMPVMAWLLISALFFAAGEFLSKKFALAPSFSFIFLLIIVNTLSLLAWLPALMQKNQLSIVGTTWSVLSLALTVLIGIMVFGEKLNAFGIAGIIFAIIAVVLLSIA